MKRTLVPVIRLHVEGDNHDLYDALRKANLAARAEEYLETRMPLDDDDPDSLMIAHFQIRTFAELEALVLAFGPVRAIRSQWHLWIQAGDVNELGVRVNIGERLFCEWSADEALITGELASALDQIRQIASRVATGKSEDA